MEWHDAFHSCVSSGRLLWFFYYFFFSGSTDSQGRLLFSCSLVSCKLLLLIKTYREVHHSVLGSPLASTGRSTKPYREVQFRVRGGPHVESDFHISCTGRSIMQI